MVYIPNASTFSLLTFTLIIGFGILFHQSLVEIVSIPENEDLNGTSKEFFWFDWLVLHPNKIKKSRRRKFIFFNRINLEI